MSARRAIFDASSTNRRQLLAKVHIAPKQLGLTEDDYRAVLLRVVAKTSAAECTEAELIQLVREFERLGFRGQLRQKSAKPLPAGHPTARKARALWISLHLLGAIEDGSEKALGAFVRRQLGVERLQWIDQTKGYKLVEALKAIAERHGWPQAVDAVPAGARMLVLKLRLVDALMEKLRVAGAIPGDWSIERAAWELRGWTMPEGATVRSLDAEQLDGLAQALGRALQPFVAAGAVR